MQADLARPLRVGLDLLDRINVGPSTTPRKYRMLFRRFLLETAKGLWYDHYREGQLMTNILKRCLDMFQNRFRVFLGISPEQNTVLARRAQLFVRQRVRLGPGQARRVMPDDIARQVYGYIGAPFLDA
jgi:hypothetical protein